jgi:hypothetical protein
MRIVAGSLAALVLGVVIAWVVVRSFEAPLSIATSRPAAPPVTATPAPTPATPGAPTATAPVAPPIVEPMAIPAPAPKAPAAATPAPILPAPSPVNSQPVIPEPRRQPAAPLPLPRPEAGASTAAGAAPAVPPPAPTPAPSPPPPAAPPLAGGAPSPAAPASPAPVATPTPAAPAPREALDQTAVIAAVREYEQAYEAMDVSKTAAVWPSVDRRALRRAFGTLQSQQLQLGKCEVTIAQNEATAHCRGSVAYVRKVGDKTPRTGLREWVFRMRKVGDAWVIDALEASPIAALMSTAASDTA